MLTFANPGQREGRAMKNHLIEAGWKLLDDSLRSYREGPVETVATLNLDTARI